jgi:phosphatidylserine decarboxylase
MPVRNQPARVRFPGIDPEGTPVVMLGLSLTGLLLGLRSRLAPWSLALTAAAAAFYRNPARETPVDSLALFAPADGTITGIEELYEHRFLHTEALVLTIESGPLDVSTQRSPIAGVVRYLHLDVDSADGTECQYIGLETDIGPVLLTIGAMPLARRVVCLVEYGVRLAAGEPLCVSRLGARTSILLPRDTVADLLPTNRRVVAGETRIGQLQPV